jgi:hypothetical protein
MKNALSFMLLLLLAGCVTSHSPTFHVTVDSYGEDSLEPGKSYVLVHKNRHEEVVNSHDSIKDLQFKEFAKCVERVLLEKGLGRTYNAIYADLIIKLSYDIDYFSYDYTTSQPIFGQTGISSSNTNANVSLYGNSANYSETTTYTPSWGVTGYRDVQRTNSWYTRKIEIEAVDIKEKMTVWKTERHNGDLRRCFPVMIAAAKDYIGTSTGKRILVQIQEDDDTVKLVKGEIHEQKND